MRALWILLVGSSVILGIIALRWTKHQGRAQGSHALAPTCSLPEVESEPEAGTSLPRPLQPGQPVPDMVLMDQDGRDFRLSDLKGSVVVLAFVYTHCNMPSMCPLATAKFVETQRRLKERGLADVRFLLVSFDTKRDRPRRLKEFASLYTPNLSTFTFATGEAGEVARLSRLLNTYYRESAPGTFEHNIVVSLLDRGGVLRDDFFGTGWEVEEMVSAIAELAEANVTMRNG